MAAATAWGWNDLPSVLLAVVAAFVCGYGLTLWGLRAAGLSRRRRLTLALAADTLSIATMEAVDNAVMLVLPGVMAAGLGDVRFWLGLVLSLAVAFAAALPVNRWLLLRGRGHALVHHHHHHQDVS